MANTKHHISSKLLTILIMIMVLASCADKEELHTDDEYPIAFAPFAAEQDVMTRATTTLGHDFIVYGYKNVNGSEQTVFDGYTVKYEAGSANTSEDNTHGYYYVDGNQTIKYWDFAASDYHFWGVWRKSEDNKASFSGDKNNILTIPDVPLRVGEPNPEDDVLFSSLYERRPVSPDVVQLSFKRPYAKLRIQFYTTEAIKDVSENISLSDITFAPDPNAEVPLVNKVYGKGNIVITYPMTKDCAGNAEESVMVNNLSAPQDALLFDDVTLTPTLGISSNTAVTAPIPDSEGFRLGDMPGASLKTKQRKAGEVTGKKYFYYPLPMGEKNPAFTMKACVNGDAAKKTTVVPATYMHWKPNYLYTYIFKITEAGKKIEFYDVKIDPWQYGGSQDEEWKNW